MTKYSGKSNLREKGVVLAHVPEAGYVMVREVSLVGAWVTGDITPTDTEFGAAGDVTPTGAERGATCDVIRTGTHLLFLISGDSSPRNCAALSAWVFPSD